MIDITGLREDKRPQSSTIVHALLDRLEAAESDAAHQKALADSALRVAEGWERKCGELRAKIEQMERQEPVAWAFRKSLVQKLQWHKPVGGENVLRHWVPLYAVPGAKGEEK